MDAEYCEWRAGKINYNFSLLYAKKQSMLMCTGRSNEPQRLKTCSAKASTFL